MTETVRLTVKELAEGLFFDPYYGNDGIVDGLISNILRGVAQNNWPTKYLGPHFRLVLTWIAWNDTTLPTYLPGSGEKIPPHMWEEAFKGYKNTWPQLVKAGHKSPFEFLKAEIIKEELKEFLVRCGSPLPCPVGGIPAKWFYEVVGHSRNVQKSKGIPPNEEKLMTKNKIAEYMGEKYMGGTCSVSSVKTWMKMEGLPHTKELNRRVVSYRSWLDEWWKKRSGKK